MTDINDNNLLPFPYLPATQAERETMLKEIGVRTFEELVSHIPSEVRVKQLDLPVGLAELELTKELARMAAKNKPASQQASFLGGGSYRRFVPSVVPAVISRSEFSTAYTPYQPEVSQGSLQAIYEFQTAICLITGMDVANASMYDAPTALAEACLMAVRLSNKKKIVLSQALNPEHRMVAETYARSCDLPFAMAPALAGGLTTCDTALDEQLADDCACFVVQYPNYFGVVEPLQELADRAHARGALLVVVTDPIALGLLKAPGDLGADIVVGDAQSCGNSLAFGGPSAGYMACRKEFIRQLPGRLAGMTVDNRGQTAFTLTLQTREQHIRRAKATSNICTNQALNALAMLVYLTSMGPQGLRDLANISLQRAHYLAEQLTAIEGVKLSFDKPFFNEFAIDLPAGKSVDRVLSALAERGVLGGLKLSTHFSSLDQAILVAVTEMNNKEELDLYAASLKEILSAEDAGAASSRAGSAQKKALTV